MTMFDELLLSQNLAKLPIVARTAFALSAASRQIQNYEIYAKRVNLNNPEALQIVSRTLWDHVLGNNSPVSRLEAHLSDMMSLIPEENEQLYAWSALADDAVSSLCYTLRHLLTEDPQEAVWAARRSYEAADQAAIKILNIALVANSEKEIVAHPIVQRELSRQERDIDILGAMHGREGLMEVKRLSFSEDFLEISEVLLLG